MIKILTTIERFKDSAKINGLDVGEIAKQVKQLEEGIHPTYTLFAEPVVRAHDSSVLILTDIIAVDDISESDD